MPGQPVKLGPFTGGLNTYSDDTAIGDSEVRELLNFDVDVDGSLYTRPPIVQSNTPPSNFAVRPLGWFSWTDGTMHLICAVNDPGGTTSTLAYRLDTNTWSTITATFAATAMVQYQNKAWLVADPLEADPGGNWDPSAGFTAVAAMKKGTAACIYKERMFIGEGGSGANSSRLSFSAPATLTTWNASDFVDVKAGDGQSIIDIYVYADTIIIFKNNSCYIYSYDSKPAAGQVRVISSTIGITAKDCIVEDENTLYIFYGKSVYSIVNWNYQKLNIKVPLEYTNTRPTDLLISVNMSKVGDRMILRYYDKYYVWGLKTRIWSMWSFATPLSRFFPLPTVVASNLSNEYRAMGEWKKGSAADTAMYSFIEGYDAVRTETIPWAVTTKSYDFESPYTFKRLFWWGVDVIAQTTLTGEVFPISYGRKITWGEAKLRTWGAAKAFTWGRGADISNVVTTVVPVAGSADRTFVKMLQAIRFRQVNFRLSGSVNGKSSTSPVRIFGITAIADTKQKVVQQIT
jgi:hypothetical protein